MMIPQPKRPKIVHYTQYDNIFSKEECEKIITFQKDMKEATVGNKPGGGYQIDQNVRRSQVSWLQCNQETQWVFNKLADSAMRANAQAFQFNLSGYGEQLQLTKYESDHKGHYDWHQDFGDGNMSTRKLSQVVLLSDPNDFKGGELELFAYKNHKLNFKQGDIISFPSYEMHRVTEVVEGTRYSLVAWISGPPFA